MKVETLCFKLGDSLLPRAFWEIEKPPPQIFVQTSWSGNAQRLLSRLPERGLAVVGTRRPQIRSLQLLSRSLRDLRGADLIVVSGLARGVDSAAHEAALEAGLPTVAVLGGSLHRIYPPENTSLRDRILEAGGLVISEHEEKVGLLPYFFLKRNRLIAGWSMATWVVEASRRSGALNTARWARDQNRDCYATPGFPADPDLAGNQELLDSHHARPFWGAHNLGATWLELATWPASSGATSARPTQKSQILQEAIGKLTLQSGGCTWADILEWSTQRGWTPEETFQLLDPLFSDGKLRQIQGKIALVTTG